MERFIDYLVKGNFMLAKCRLCSSIIWPPNIVCNRCLSKDVEWVNSEPIGKVIALSRSYVSSAETFAMVELDNGVELFASIEGYAEEGSRVKMVECGVKDGRPYYIFRVLQC